MNSRGVHNSLIQNSLIYSKYCINLVFFFLQTEGVDGKLGKCEALAREQTAWHLINSTKLQFFALVSLFLYVYALFF